MLKVKILVINLIFNFIFGGNLIYVNASEIPANGQLNPSQSEVLILNPLSDSREVSQVKEIYQEFSILLDTLSKQEQPASVLLGPDGKVHTATRTQDGSTQYVINGDVIWSGCAFMSCNLGVAQEIAPANTNPGTVGNEISGGIMFISISEQILALEKELSDIAEQIKAGQVSDTVTGVSNAEVLKSLVSLYASGSKQLQALQKAEMRNRGLVVLDDLEGDFASASKNGPVSSNPISEQILISDKKTTKQIKIEGTNWLSKKVTIVFKKNGKTVKSFGRVDNEGVLLIKNKKFLKDLQSKSFTISTLDGKNKRVVKIK